MLADVEVMQCIHRVLQAGNDDARPHESCVSFVNLYIKQNRLFVKH